MGSVPRGSPWRSELRALRGARLQPLPPPEPSVVLRAPPPPSSAEATQAIVCTGVRTADPALSRMPGSGKGGCGGGLIICFFRVKFILSVACLTFF